MALLLGVLIAAVGITGFAFLLINNFNPDLRIVIPGSYQVEMTKGSYTLFDEYRSEINGQVYSSDFDVPGIRVAVISSEDVGVELNQPTSNKSYEIGGRSGYSVLNFQIDSSGIYTVVGGYPDRGAGVEIVMAIGKDNSGSLFLAILSLLGGLGIGAALFVHTFMKRRDIGPDAGPVVTNVTEILPTTSTSET
jgi:hypothetical protein